MQVVLLVPRLKQLPETLQQLSLSFSGGAQDDNYLYAETRRHQDG